MNLTLAFDAGTSGSKVLACYPSSFSKRHFDRLFLLKPAVRSLITQTYEALVPRYQNATTNPDDGLVSYYSVLQEKQLHFQIGYEATTPGFLPVQDPKLVTYVAKILTVIGYLVAHKCKQDEVELNLGCLLPFNEWADRGLLEQLLTGIFSGDGFQFNGHPIRNVRLQSLEIQPEGYGICRYYLNHATHLLMMGQRDSAWLSFNNGRISLTDSLPLPKSGMHSFIKSLMESYRVDDELKMSQIISAAGPKMRPKALRPLTTTGSDREIQQLQQAISMAKAQFWAERSRIFKSLNVKGGSKVYISGGCGYYFAPEITQMFKARGIKLDWCKELIAEFDQRYPGHQKERLPYRMADAYAFYCRLPNVPPFSPKTPALQPCKPMSPRTISMLKQAIARSEGEGGSHG